MIPQAIASIITGALLWSCASPTPTPESTPDQEHVARVTYYWNDPITAKGTVPKSGRTIAVDPKVIPYFSKIHIPKMQNTFLATDTGPAVRARTASRRWGKDNIVVDVYCSNKAEASRKIKKYPMFMKIKVYEPRD